MNVDRKRALLFDLVTAMGVHPRAGLELVRAAYPGGWFTPVRKPRISRWKVRKAIIRFVEEGGAVLIDDADDRVRELFVEIWGIGVDRYHGAPVELGTVKADTRLVA
ncbi:MAG: hypothetical protein S0880_31200 [Actinomycetota bacterium]|nr:hypothetical protein [Actinomycetota bacterium]